MFFPASSLQRIGYSFINDHGRGAWENERVHWCFFDVFSELTWVKLVVEYNLKKTKWLRRSAFSWSYKCGGWGRPWKLLADLERPISCCGKRQFSNQAIERSKPCALPHRCRYQSYQERGNRTQETKIAPVGVTKIQISNSAFTSKARDQRKQGRVLWVC